MNYLQEQSLLWSYENILGWGIGPQMIINEGQQHSGYFSLCSITTCLESNFSIKGNWICKCLHTISDKLICRSKLTISCTISQSPGLFSIFWQMFCHIFCVRSLALKFWPNPSYIKASKSRFMPRASCDTFLCLLSKRSKVTLQWQVKRLVNRKKTVCPFQDKYDRLYLRESMEHRATFSTCH